MITNGLDWKNIETYTGVNQNRYNQIKAEFKEFFTTPATPVTPAVAYS